MVFAFINHFHTVWCKKNTAAPKLARLKALGLCLLMLHNNMEIETNDCSFSGQIQILDGKYSKGCRQSNNR